MENTITITFPENVTINSKNIKVMDNKIFIGANIPDAYRLDISNDMIYKPYSKMRAYHFNIPTDLSTIETYAAVLRFVETVNRNSTGNILNFYANLDDPYNLRLNDSTGRIYVPKWKFNVYILDMSTDSESYNAEKIRLDWDSIVQWLGDFITKPLLKGNLEIVPQNFYDSYKYIVNQLLSDLNMAEDTSKNNIVLQFSGHIDFINRFYGFAILLCIFRKFFGIEGFIKNQLMGKLLSDFREIFPSFGKDWNLGK